MVLQAGGHAPTQFAASPRSRRPHTSFAASEPWKERSRLPPDYRGWVPKVPLTDEEERVRGILQVALSCRVEQWDDQSSPGMYDLVAHTSAGDAAIEVVGNKDERTRKRMDAGRRLTDLSVPTLTSAWRVGVGNDANIKDVRRRTPAALAHLEALGVTDVDVLRDDGANVSLLSALHLTQARVIDGAPAGSVTFFTGMSWVGSVMPIDELASYAEEVLAANADVAPKLGRSGLEGRHAVVVVSPDRMDVLMALDDWQLKVPSAHPHVAEAITDVWLIPCSPGDRIVRWTRGGSWRCVGVTPAP